LHASDVPEEHIGTLVSSLFEIADELDVKADEGRGMLAMANNNLRVHWLLNRLVRDRLDRATRIPILREAMKTASLYWYCNFAESCYSDHFPADHQRHIAEDQRWVDERTAKLFHRSALTRIRKAAEDGSIAQQRRLVIILYEWVRFAPKGIKEVRAKVKKLLANDEFVSHLAIDAFHLTWSHSLGFGGMGDLVARGTPQINKEAIRYFSDEKKFMGRVRERQAAATEAGELLFWKTFIEAWERPETDRFGGPTTP
jgi:predicted KAP-like P-loop ATPase